MSLSYASKYKIDTDLLLIGGNEDVLHHQIVLLIDSAFQGK